MKNEQPMWTWQEAVTVGLGALVLFALDVLIWCLR
jgi:hypothetical protein